MSFGGILATALAGGAGVIGKQAGDDIEAQRKADMLKQQADIEFQTQQRLAEMRQRLDRDQTLWKTQGEGGTATLDFNRRDIEQRNDLAIKGEVAKATNPELLAAEDARADAELARKIKAGKALLPLEIERASKLAAADAGTRAKYREKPQTMAEKAAELETFLGRKLLPEERERMSGLTKGGAQGEETVKTTKYDANGQPIEERTVKGPRGAAQDAPAPIDPPAAAVEYLRKNPNLKAEFDAKFGKGAAERVLAGAEQKPAAADRPARPKPMIQTGPIALAESQLRQATERLNSYGSSQRQRDPDGFREAQARVAEARAALAAAQDADAGPITDSDRKPAMRYAAP